MFISQLIRALELLRTEVDCDIEALDSILKTITSQTNSIKSEPAEETMIRKWTEACGISRSDQSLLVAFLCQDTSHDTEVNEGRSVKTL